MCVQNRILRTVGSVLDVATLYERAVRREERSTDTELAVRCVCRFAGCVRISALISTLRNRPRQTSECSRDDLFALFG